MNRGRPGWLGALLRRLHFLAGILVGPFLLVAAVSGGLYALSPQLEKVVYADVLRAPVTASTLTLAEQIRIAEDVVDEGSTLSAVRPAPSAGDTTRVMFAQEGLPPSTSHAVFIDPGTGEVRGALDVYGTSGALPLRTWIDEFHRSLHLGDAGRLYSELAASWLWIVAGAGAVLWAMRWRRSRRRRDLLRPDTRQRGYRGLFGWHAPLGIWLVVGAFFLSATGITWSQLAGERVADIRSALGGATPVVSTTLDGAEDDADAHAGHHGPVAAPSGAAHPETFDAVLAIAQRINVDTGLVEIRPPAEPGTAWVVQEIQRSYPTEVDAVAIDGTTMEVVDRVDFEDYPLLAKLSRWGVDLHMGSMFGLPHQLALAALAAGIAALVVLGYAMWIARRRPGDRVGGVPARGALRGAPWWGVAAVAAVAAVVGLVLPLVGVTLLGLLVVDTGIGVLRRTRA